MARKLRVFVTNTPVHILIRSLDTIELFPQTSDLDFFKTILLELNQKYNVSIHAYTLGQTFCEFLITPSATEDLPRFMQTLGRSYVTYYNKKYNRIGTLWQSRYKSSVVDADSYLFDVMCFIEKKQNILRNSQDKNLYNKEDKIITFHTKYKDLSTLEVDRKKKYQKIFNEYNHKKDTFIEKCLEKQNITGSENYIRNLELKLGIILSAKKRGRPKKEVDLKAVKVYKDLQVLDKQKHKNLKINLVENLEFAKQIIFVPLLFKEVDKIGIIFPIVFSSNNNTLASIVSLGGESLAINKQGKWIGDYLPISLRDYPLSLVFSKSNPEKKIILINENSKALSETIGKPLFRKNAEESEILKNIIDFLSTHENEVLLTKNIIKEIEKEDILEESKILSQNTQEKKVLVSGFKVVNKEKLNNLSDDILASWARKGIISFIDNHLKSLENIQRLFELENKQ